MFGRLREWAKSLKREALMLWLAARDPRTPIVAKLVAGFAAAYAFSPIDLIPDFIPVLGLIDDLVILPLAIAFAVKRIPPTLVAELRERAAALAERPVSSGAALVVATIWVGILAALWWRFGA